MVGLHYTHISGPAYQVRHFSNSGGIFLPRALVLFARFPLQVSPHPLLHSCILPSMAAAFAAPSTLSSPHFYTIHQHEPQNCLCPPKLPVPQCHSRPRVLTPAQLEQRPLLPPASLPSGTVLLFPSSAISSPSLLMYLLFQNFSRSFSLLASGASIAALWGQACLQRCGLEARVGSALVCAKQELCFCQALSPWLLRAHF